MLDRAPAARALESRSATADLFRQGGPITAVAIEPAPKRVNVKLRSQEMRDISRGLATLGHIRLQKGSPLNVRQREQVRRTLAEAGESLGWSEVAARDQDPVKAVSKDVRKMLRKGVKSLSRGVANDLVSTEAEVELLEELVDALRALSETPDALFPVEFTYSRPARDHGSGGFMTRKETLVLNNAEEAGKAALKIEKALPRWHNLREQMVADLRQHEASLAEVNSNLTFLIDGWRRLLGEVLVTMA